MKILTIDQEASPEDLGIQPGDDLLEINGQVARDTLDLRFHEGDEEVALKVARDGEVTIYEIEKEGRIPSGSTVEEMKILSCGNDCIFCFVDQNPKGLRKQLYFRDGDYRLSFMYGNYTTMTNAGPATLRRIIEQRLCPQYISVHVTDYEVRRKLMGLQKDDRILEKIKLLHDNGIDMHTQIVLCPGINDGAVLEKTVMDLVEIPPEDPVAGRGAGGADRPPVRAGRAEERRRRLCLRAAGRGRGVAEEVQEEDRPELRLRVGRIPHRGGARRSRPGRSTTVSRRSRTAWGSCGIFCSTSAGSRARFHRSCRSGS